MSGTDLAQAAAGDTEVLPSFDARTVRLVGVTACTVLLIQCLSIAISKWRESRASNRSKLVQRLRLAQTCASICVLCSCMSCLFADLGVLTCVAAPKCMCFFYAQGTFFILYFLHLKSRLVRFGGAQQISKLEKFILFNTFPIVPFGVLAAILVSGHPHAGNLNLCIFDIPWELSLVMAIANVGISSMFLYLFVSPLRQLKDSATAEVRNSMKQNLRVCSVVISTTCVSMIVYCVADATRDPNLLPLLTLLAPIDTTVNILGITYITGGSKNKAKKANRGTTVARSTGTAISSSAKSAKSTVVADPVVKVSISDPIVKFSV